MRKVQAGGIIRKSLDNAWGTPESLLAAARLVLGDPLPFDPATAQDNPTRAARFCAGAGPLFDQESLASKNGLHVAWDWPTWVNPPYGAELKLWCAKIRDEAARLHRPILALLPCSRWETSYWPEMLARARIVCFHRGRVKFISSIDGKAVGGNPGANMIVGFNVNEHDFTRAWSPLGACFKLSPSLPPVLR